MKFHRRLAVLSFAIVSAAGFAGYQAQAQSGPAAKTDFVIAGGEVDIIDPIQIKSPTAQTVDANIYGTLLEQVFDPASDGSRRSTGGFRKGLAEDYSVAGDGTITFRIGSNLSFSDGSPLTAHDVVYSLRRTLSAPSYVRVSNSYFLRISDPGSQIVALDDRTVQMKPDGPSPSVDRFFSLLTYSILSARAGKQSPGENGAATKYFGSTATPSGPFLLENWSGSESITLAKNKRYLHADDVKADKITILNMPDESQRLLALRNGDIDIALSMSPRIANTASQDSSLVVYKTAGTNVYFLGLNPTIAPFDNKSVRLAIAHAIPYDLLMKEVMFGQARAAYGAVPDGMGTSLAPDAAATQYKTDPDAARALLAEAGVSNLTVDLSVASSDQIASASAVYIQYALAQIGIKVNIRALASADFQTRAGKRQLGMFISTWASWVQDPFFQMRAVLVSGQFTNQIGFSSPDFDKLVTAGTLETDRAKRLQLSKQAQQIVLDEANFVGLFVANSLIVARSDVGGIALGDDLILRLKYLTRK
jgi:peptide/nickel transport system substrate-binding protein